MKLLRDVQLNNYGRVRWVRVKCSIHGRKNLGDVGGAITLEICSLEKFFVYRCKNARDRTLDGIDCEAGETQSTAFTT